jgi:MYXO-CTERM domain-containing protein
MNKTAARLRSRPALESLEDAVRLLRRAPATVLVLHFLGSAPCMLYAVYFYTDLSRSPFAAGHLLGSALTFTLLYAWMKCWQAASAAHLRAALLGQSPPRWDAARVMRLVAAQVCLHPFGLVVRAIAGTLLVPWVWAATFCQNVSVLGDGTAGPGEVAASAWREALRWPGRAHALAGFLALFGFFIFVNLLATLAAVPLLLKSLFGIETVFSHYLLGLFNPVTFVAVFAMTYLLLDPLRKAAIVMRCFHGRSLRTGEDLAARMQDVRRTSLAAVAALAATFLCGPLAAPIARAAEPVAHVEPAPLDRSIDDVLDQREFTWRAGRVKPREIDPAQLSAFGKWLRDAGAWIERMGWKLGRVLKRWIESWRDRRGDSSRNGDGSSWFGSVQTWFWIVLAVTLVLLALLLVRRRRRSLVVAAEAVAAAAAPDLRDETVTADQLPEEGWLRLAAELLDRGEFRLALRAFYLAGLAHLGGKNLLQLARHKSNRDYDRELRRRARTRDDLLAAFDLNLAAFERSWYGDHAVTPETLQAVAGNLERIRAC